MSSTLSANQIQSLRENVTKKVLTNKTILIRNKVKSQLCKSVLDSSYVCPYGSKCDFAHSLYELKKIPCLFGEACNNISSCPYDHSKLHPSFIPKYKSWADDVDLDEEDIEQDKKDLNRILDCLCLTPSSDETSVSFDEKHKPREEDGELKIYNLEITMDSSKEDQLIRGIIVNGKGEIVCKSCPFIPEVCISDKEFEDIIRTNLPYCDVFESMESSFVRVWQYENKWRVSTHRKINAFSSCFGSAQSFGDIFESLLKKYNYDSFADFCQELNPEHIYLFSITTDMEDRKVSRHQEKQLLSLGSYDRSNSFKYVFEAPPGNIKFPKVCYFPRPEDLISKIEKIDIWAHQGFMMINRKNGRIFKIVNSEYVRLNNIRGNCPNIFQRYMEIRRSPIESEFRSLYSEHVWKFDMMEDNLKKMARFLLDEHYNRVNNKIYNKVCHDHYVILDNLKKYCIKNKVYYPRVADVHYFITDYQNNVPKGTFKIAKLLLPQVEFPSRISPSPETVVPMISSVYNEFNSPISSPISSACSSPGLDVIFSKRCESPIEFSPTYFPSSPQESSQAFKPIVMDYKKMVQAASPKSYPKPTPKKIYIKKE